MFFSSIQTHSQLVLWHLLSQSHFFFQIALPRRSLPFFEFESVTWLFCGCGRWWRARSWGRIKWSEVKESTNLTKHLSCWNGIAKLKRIIFFSRMGMLYNTPESEWERIEQRKKRNRKDLCQNEWELFSEKIFLFAHRSRSLFKHEKVARNENNFFSSTMKLLLVMRYEDFSLLLHPHPGYLVNTQHDFSLLPLLVRLERLQIMGRSLNFNTN